MSPLLRPGGTLRDLALELGLLWPPREAPADPSSGVFARCRFGAYSNATRCSFPGEWHLTVETYLRMLGLKPEREIRQEELDDAFGWWCREHAGAAVVGVTHWKERD